MSLTTPKTTPIPDAMAAFFGEEHGPTLRLALNFIARVSPEVISEAREKLELTLAFGPMLHPSDFTDGTRFDHGREWQKILSALANLRAALPELDARRRELAALALTEEGER